MAENNRLLEIKNLYVNFRVYNGVAKVLDNVNFHVANGERVGLVGESGCGKTTTVKSILRVLARQAEIPSGEIIFDGKNVLKMSESALNRMRSQRLSMIFQDPTASLNPAFTIGRQVGDAIKYSGIIGKKDRNGIRQRSIKALADCSMPDPERILHNYPFQLSGGMRQRVCIAMALATASNLLIADEPTTNLDVTIQDQVLHLIHDLVEQRGTALILITHSLGVAKQMTDRICVMYAGSIVEEARTANIFEEACHPYTKGLLESVPKLTGDGILSGIAGSLPSYLTPPQGCRFRDRCKYALPKCATCKPNLYQVSTDHKAACFLYENGGPARTATALQPCPRRKDGRLSTDG